MENEKQSNEYLGEEKIGKLLLKFSLPCVLSLIIQALYNLVDQIFIGHSPSLGAVGNAATGIVYPLTLIALGLGLWLGDGSAAVMSINQGRKDSSRTAAAVANSITAGVICGAILTAVVLIFNESVLSAMGAQGEILTKAEEYSFFISVGFIFYILASVINPIVRADGSPRFAMIAMSAGAVVNIIFDPIFIFGANMGMTGAALATFMGQVLTFLLNVGYLFKSKTFRIRLKDFRPDFRLVGQTLKFGATSFLTQLAIVIISVTTNALLKNYSVAGGYDAQITQGVFTLAFKVFGIIVSIIIGVACGGQPIVGYNYGAKNYRRVKQTYKYIIIISLIVGIIATLLFECCPQVFLAMFGDGGDGVDKTAYAQFTALTFRKYLSLIAFTCIVKATSIFLQSMGRPVLAAVISMCRDVVFLVPATVVLCIAGGVNAMLWSGPITDVLSLILSAAIIIAVFKKYLNDENQVENQSKQADKI